jgi:nucleotide-binding universal stress UspA family protein
MAEQLGASITVFHVLYISHLESAKLADALQLVRRDARERLNQFPGPGLEFPNLHRELGEGSPADCIVQRGASMEAPLIMMPTRGHTRFRQLLLGSVTAAVLHDADCPVWTEAHTESAPPPARTYRSLVCAVDLGGQTAGLLAAAEEYRRHFGASLYVAHAVPRGDPRFPSGMTDRAHAFLVDAAQERYAGCCQEAGVAFPLEILEDVGLVNCITGAIHRHQADLLLIGRGVIQGPLGRLRSNAHNLIRNSPCPVLSI